MSVYLSVALSDDLYRDITCTSAEDATGTSEIFRKALQPFLAAREGKRRGLKLGLIEPETERLHTEIIGL